MMCTKKFFKRGLILGLALLAILAWCAPAALAQQVPLNPTNIPQFVNPLPLLDGAGGTMVTADGTGPLTIRMCEFTANILPAGTKLPKKKVYAGTKVWGYLPDPTGT